jgi:hypothetical protein
MKIAGGEIKKPAWFKQAGITSAPSPKDNCAYYAINLSQIKN